MIKKFISKCIIWLGILLNFSYTLATDEKDETSKLPLSAFYTTSPSGTDVTLDRGNITRYLEVKAVDNPLLPTVNNLILRGEWTAEDISTKLRPLFFDHIPNINGALVRMHLSIDPKDLVVFNGLIPLTTKVIKDSFEKMETSLSYNDIYYMRSFDFLPPELNEYELELNDIPLKDIRDKLPNVRRLKISHKGLFFTGFEDARVFSLKSLRDLTICGVTFSENRFEDFMKGIPPQITRVSIINHRTQFTIKGLNRCLDKIHDDIEFLDLSSDIPLGNFDHKNDEYWQVYNESSQQYETIPVTPDVMHLKRLETLNLSGLGFPSDISVQSASQLSYSVKPSRNPVLCALLEGQEVSPFDLQELPNDLVCDLKDYLRKQGHDV